MFMLPSSKGLKWDIGGEIDIMTNVQIQQLGSGIHYNSPHIFDGLQDGLFSANTSLDDFNIYSLEWNQFEIKWFFNDYNYFTRNISRKLGTIYDRNGQPFDQPFRLIISLGVGGSSFFGNSKLTEDDVIDWKCSLYILDYVRIYSFVNERKI